MTDLDRYLTDEMIEQGREGVAARLRWASIHWGTEGLHSDAIPHIARAALEAAKAWDEGHRTPQKREMDDCQCSAWSSSECACGKYGTGKLITPNPYRKDS